MDVNAVSEVFAASYNPDPNTRLAAELQLGKVLALYTRHDKVDSEDIDLG
jgi:hypothetical protein